MKNNIHNKYGGGQILAFSGIDGDTDYRNAIVARTALNGIGLTFPTYEKQLELKFPYKAEDCRRITGDGLLFSNGSESTEVIFWDSRTICLRGPVEISGTPETLNIRSENEITIIDLDDSLSMVNARNGFDVRSEQANAWLMDTMSKKPRNFLHSRAYSKALAMMKNQVYSPEGEIKHFWTSPDKWPHKNMWLWDSVFHAIGWRHLDLSLAKEMIEAVFDRMDEHGFIPHMSTPYEKSEITQPPVLAMGVASLLEIEKDRDFLSRVYPSLKAYLAWDRENRDSDGGGLTEWFIEGDKNCRSGESGMDNSPRFDCAQALDAVDFNAFLAMEYECMARFAEELDLPKDREFFQNSYNRIKTLINQRLWNRDISFYCDAFAESGVSTGIMASSGFLPLLAGIPDASRAARLIEYLKDPRHFAAAVPVPSLPRSSELYDKDMWRGPSWINLNWLICRGLERYGYHNESREIRDKSLEVILKYYETEGTFFEYYDDRDETSPPRLNRKGKNEAGGYHQVIFDYGWTATLFVDWIHRKYGAS